MGRPPCCDKDGIKKGPWTPEEDIILASYIQEYGPGNWRLVPKNTGLLRCSKSCRLRWTNYLRPGIKRGNFTSHEERMIVHLQALLGNKWASIASYLPHRTDNDIKNYWNTHLKKKLKKFQSSLDPLISSSSTTCKLIKRFTGHKKTNQASLFRLNQASTYASSTENISRLLEGWMKSSPKTTGDVGSGKNQVEEEKQSDDNKDEVVLGNKSGDDVDDVSCDVISHEELDSLLVFENMSMAWEKFSSESTNHESQTIHNYGKFSFMGENEEKLEDQPPFSFLEKWLLDESSVQQGELMDLSPIF